MSLNWKKSVFLTEVKNILSYRVEFWLNFFTAVGVQLVIAYFIWRSIFEYNNVDQMRGYSLQVLVLYFLIVAIFGRVTRGQDIGVVSRDIYEGTLTKYIIYPLPFFQYKLITYTAYSCFYFAQFLIVMTVYLLVFGVPEGIEISLTNFFMSSITLALGAFVYFLITICVEMITFWADKTWSLMVMLRMTAGYLGGGIIPLTFFPEWAKSILFFTPFPHFLSRPTRLLLGLEGFSAFSNSLLILGLWALFLPMLAKSIWNRGKYNYTGVGI